MFGGFETFVARRYLLTKKKTGFISIISVISIAGIALGVAALIIVLSLMNGFTKELRTRLVGMDGHIWVSTPMERGMSDYDIVMGMLSKIKGVQGVSPFCEYQTIAHDRGRNNAATVIIRGVDVNTVGSVSDLKDYINAGSLDLGPDENGIPGIVVGRFVAIALNSTQIGDRVYLWAPTDINEIIEDMTPPPVHQFRIAGIFDSGYYDYDNAVGLIDLAEAQKILGLESMVSGVVVKLDKVFDVERYTREDGLIDQSLGGYPYYSMSWIEKNKALFSWMKLEKWSALIVLSLIVVVAAFNIVSSLIMIVMDKTSEVGILKSMGATKKSIHKIFVYQGAFVGICGTLIGSIIGYSLCYLQETYRLLSLPPDIYFVSAVPVELQISDFVVITAIALFLCWFSSFYPAKKAAELDPVDAIRSK
ncbi:FtsX-like permease family protein [Candidatus Latescibacterota bacterium]